MKPLTVLTVAVLVLGACLETGDRRIGVPKPGESTCEDGDGDGFGEGCEAGGDCDDRDHSVHVGCTRCIAPADGCECDDGAKAVSCYREPSMAEDGTVMCHEGTRYCRERRWSACESIVSYPRPEELETQAVLDPMAPVRTCNDCTVNCFVVRDNLDPTDAGLKNNSSNIVGPKTGGLTLNAKIPDAGTGSGPVFDPSKCVLGAAPDQDCDGIPDIYDPYPLQKPFATANPTLFLDVAPGQTGTGVVNLQFYLNSADVYFMVDQSNSMTAERDRLKADLTTGDFVNDSSYDCADYDFDRRPNNELKTQGIIGAVRCMIRDANFGVGYFREIPLSYGAADSVTYRNLSDITADIAKVTSAVSRLDTVGNNDWPEASMLALYAMVTGNGFYFGPDRTGLAPRTDCPSLSYGYPCFRNNAIPIVVMFTDAQFHQGPVNEYAYSPAVLGMSSGTVTTHTPIRSTNETYTNAQDLGDITNANLTMIGNTDTMASDFTVSQATCGAAEDKSPDAMFKFSLSATKTVTATTFGSDFDTTLSIFRGTPPASTTLPSFPNTNDLAASAYSFGNITNKFVVAAGDSSGLKHDYSANDVSCGAAADGKDATFTFNVPSATRVALSTRGSSYGTSMALFSSAPVQNSYTAIPDTNDDVASAYSAGSINTRNAGYSGNTSAAAIMPTFTSKQIGCTGTAAAADAAPDAVYKFSLSQATRVRVSSEDSTLKSVLALTNDTGVYINTSAAGVAHETAATALNAGSLDGRAVQYTGDTRSMRADYSSSLTQCGTSDTSRDAVFSFNLAAQRTVEIDTLNSEYDTSVSLFRTAIGSGATTVAANNTNEIASSALDLGSINTKNVSVTGATTYNMVADFTNAQVGCNSSSSARDAVYKFSLSTPTRVRIDTAGSSFDTVASLHSNLPIPSSVNLDTPPTNEAVASAYTITGNNTSYGSVQSFNSSTATMAANVNINTSTCAADFAAKDAVFRIDIGTAGNYELNTEGSAFDTVLGFYPASVADAAPPTASAQGNAGDKKASAINIGTLDGKWLAYSGTTTGLPADYNFTSCGMTANAPDAYYRFTLATQRTVVINTIGSSFDTVLALTSSTDVEQTCNNDFSGTASQITRTLNAGTYYVIVKGRLTTSHGNYRLSFRDNVVTDISNTLACDDNSGSGGITSKLTGYAAAGTYYAVVKGKTAADSGNYRLTLRNLDAIAATGRISCDDNTAGNGDSQIEADLAAGEYFVVVKGTSSTARGTYSLRVQDRTNPPGYVTCNDDLVYGTQASRITQTLPAGSYYVVLRGYSTASGVYTITMRDTAVTYTTNYACDYNSGPSGTSLIERDLAAGSYRVVVKGLAATDKGAYKINIRDVTAVPPNRLACDATAGAGNSSYLERDLAAGTYTVVLKSSSGGGSGGAYQLSVRDATRVTGFAASFCNNNYVTDDTYSRVSQSLTAGTYYALVKGNKTSDKGLYQFNIGAVSTTATTFVPPTWAQTQAALNAKKVKVIPVLSCQDDREHGNGLNGLGDCSATRTQARALATATGALGTNLQPLVFDVNSDGAGLSKTIITGIGALANYLEMNVSVRVVFEPDPNPGFSLVLRAVDVAGDGCTGISATEHKRCAPGASPRFELAFTNPAATPVRNNPADPNGGYNFRAELIGDQQFIVDKVPIYIIPHSVAPAPPTPVYVPSGSYWQDLSATKCVGTQRPDWHDLTWNADLPEGTTLSFGVCASESKTQLSTCTPTPLATVTGGRSCAQNSDCTDGYCASTRTCHYVTAGRCTKSEDCTRGATCKTGVCKFGGQPVYIGDALKDKNYTSNLRMQIGLGANTTANTAPTVYDWSLNYFCNSAQ